MKKLLTLASAIIAATLATLPLLATAHHSMSEFDRGVVREVEGVVSRVSWRNPHILMEVTSTDENGAIVKCCGSLRDL